MTISNELLQAILALDSYNRGYQPGVNLEGDSLGGYTILMDSEEVFRLPEQDPDALSPAGAANFYAVAYQDASGNIVISYRGTDDPWGDLTTGQHDRSRALNPRTLPGAAAPAARAVPLSAASGYDIFAHSRSHSQP